MRVEMLRGRLYRGEALSPGFVTDMDGQTAAWFIEQGWAREYTAPAPMTVEKAEELVPTKIMRRKALR